MEVEDEPLLFQTSWGGEEEEEEEEQEEEDGVAHAAGQNCFSREAGVCGIWRAVGWVYTQPCASGVVLGVVVLLPCALFAYMLLYCPPLDIDLSYSAFEVHSHFSAERFDALTIAVKTQLGSWDRRRRDLDDSESEALQELLLERLGRQGVFNRTDNEGMWSSTPQKEPSHAGDDEKRGARDERTVPDLGQEEMGKHKNSDHRGEEDEDRNSTLVIRRRRFTPNYYLQSQALWRIELVFVAQGEGDRNIFTPERLQTIHHVERLLMQHPQFHQFCWKPLEMLRDLPLGPSYCSPPSSLLSYLYPSERGGKIYYDGMGPDLADIQGSLSLAITHPQFYWYVDESLSPEHLSSSLLRSEIHFGAPLPSYYSLQDRADEQRSRFKNFVVQYADILANQSTSQVKVLYGGTELFDDEVRHTFHNDMMLAVISGACITVLVYVLTSFSVFLTFFGLASIGLSCLMALFLYHVVFGVRYLGILNGVAAFVIIGIGVDDVFVFISTFRQASHLRQPQQRMIYTIKTAGRATFLTSFTTAAAYAANTFSQIPAVHDFGLFMALIVSCCWLWVSVLMPAALCVWTQCVEPQEHAWLNCWKLFSGLSASHGPLSDEDDDVALLSVEMEPGTTKPLSLSRARFLRHRRRCSHSFPVSGDTSVPSRATACGCGEHKSPVGPKALSGRASCGATESSSRCLPPGSALICRVLLSPEASHSRPTSFPPGHEPPDAAGSEKQPQLVKASPALCAQVCSWKSHTLLKPNSSTNQTGSLLTVYVSKLDLGASTTLYRFSLNTSTPSPWKLCSTDHQEVSTFQAYNHPRSNYTSRMTVCVSHVYHPYPSWMITSTSCDPRHGWTPEFSFYAASSPQQHSRRLYFAQLRLRPHPSRVCVTTPGCGISSGPDGPTQGTFYTPLPSDPSSAAKTKPSKTFGFNPCSGGACGHPAVRPLVDTGAMVFVVFGILGVNRTERRDNHVIGDMGSIILDPDFDIFQEMGRGAQCLPSGNKLSSILPLLHPECHSLPEPNLLPGQLSHGAVGMHGGKVRWLSMAFESTTYKGKSSFQTYSDFLQWENFIQEQLAALPQSSALQRGFQTCEHWKQIFMEIIGVESALWSLLLSLAICVAAVSVFTAHPLLLLPVLITILGVICLVVAIMYWLGWEMGAVEAISLSILVGSSVDYCLHLVEGYLLAGETMSSTPNSETPAERQRRTLEAVNHVGVAIVSSAVTTVISTVPLFFCVIVPFAKFGQIVAINTAVSILFTLTVTVAMLAFMAPARFSRTPGAVLKASLAVMAAAALGAGVCWVGGQLGAMAWQSIST
ncbi:Protein dispatched-like protein 3 [Larimichthys crocea]|uniref:Protein dispatched-like protein 3 n=1 Tax=Larimichthys crocea TaxID=215358 RepID=A0A6G0ILF7_LARCR|nr:Protein dispatched-like protein 3 [Larimichthys crocea]